MGRKYEQILVPYDGSKYYKKSLEEAIEIAKKFGSNIHLLHVIDALTAIPPVYDSPDTIMDMKELGRVLKNVVSKSDLILRNEILRCKEKGVDADYKIITGSVAEVILKFAKKN